MTDPEDLQRFAALLDTCGSDRTRWPLAEATFADALIKRSDAARRELDRARALDALLDHALPVTAIEPSRLRSRVLEALSPHDRFGAWLAWLGRGPWLLRPLAMALVPLVLGLGVGAALPQTGGDGADMLAELNLLAFDAAEAYRDAQ